MRVSQWQMSTEYLCGPSNYTQMNLSGLVGRLSLELVSALHNFVCGEMTALGMETNELLEHLYADEIIIQYVTSAAQPSEAPLVLTPLQITSTVLCICNDEKAPAPYVWR